MSAWRHGHPPKGLSREGSQRCKCAWAERLRVSDTARSVNIRRRHYRGMAVASLAGRRYSHVPKVACVVCLFSGYGVRGLGERVAWWGKRVAVIGPLRPTWTHTSRRRGGLSADWCRRVRRSQRHILSSHHKRSDLLSDQDSEQRQRRRLRLLLPCKAVRAQRHGCTR